MPPGTTPETICDWDFIVAGLADLSPILPKDKPAYQSMSFGWILGEIVRRTDSARRDFGAFLRSEEHTSELQSLMRISSAVFCLKYNINSHTLILCHLFIFL